MKNLTLRIPRLFIFLGSICLVLLPGPSSCQDFIPDKSGSHWIFRSEKGKADLSIPYDSVKPFLYGWAPVMQEGKWGCIDHKNIWVVPPAYEDLTILQAELLRFRLAGKYGIMDNRGQILLQPEFDRIDHFRDGSGTVKKNGTWYSISPDGLSLENIIFEYPDVKAVMEGCEPDETDCYSRKIGMALYPNIRYPARARESGIQGTVILSAMIQRDGKITDHRLHRGIHPLLDEEALRNFQLIDFNWIPAIQEGLPVVSRIFFPLKFSLSPRRH